MTWVLRSRSLHYLSTVRTVTVSIEEADCVFQRRRTQVHVHLGRRQVPVPSQSCGPVGSCAPPRGVPNRCVTNQEPAR